MGPVALAARLVLGAVFVISGLSKLVDQRATRVALEAFHVPPALTTVGAAVLPVAELAVAAALVSATTAAAGAAGALVLLAVFIVAMAISLVRGGRQPDCHCFGQLRSGPVSWATLVRNGVLAVLAAAILLR